MMRSVLEAAAASTPSRVTLRHEPTKKALSLLLKNILDSLSFCFDIWLSGQFILLKPESSAAVKKICKFLVYENTAGNFHRWACYNGGSSGLMQSHGAVCTEK